jgi:hypothetical protein
LDLIFFLKKYPGVVSKPVDLMSVLLLDRCRAGDALLTTTQMEDLLSSEVIVEVLNFLVL